MLCLLLVLLLKRKKKAGLPTLLEQIPLNRCQQRHRTNTLLTDLATCTSERRNSGNTDRGESEDE